MLCLSVFILKRKADRIISREERDEIKEKGDGIEIEHISESFDWKTQFGPEEIVNLIASIIEQLHFLPPPIL